MEKIKIYYDEIGNILNVWFDDPQKEVISEEVGDEVSRQITELINSRGKENGYYSKTD